MCVSSVSGGSQKREDGSERIRDKNQGGGRRRRVGGELEGKQTKTKQIRTEKEAGEGGKEKQPQGTRPGRGAVRRERRPVALPVLRVRV